MFGDEGEAVAAGCPVCGKQACFCTRDLEAGVSPVLFNLVPARDLVVPSLRPASVTSAAEAAAEAAAKKAAKQAKKAKKAAAAAAFAAAQAAPMATVATVAAAAVAAAAAMAVDSKAAAKKTKAAAKHAKRARASADGAEAAAGGTAAAGGKAAAAGEKAAAVEKAAAALDKAVFGEMDAARDKAARKAARKAAKKAGRQADGCAATAATAAARQDAAGEETGRGEAAGAPPRKRAKGDGGDGGDGGNRGAEVEEGGGTGAPSGAVASLRSAEEWEAMLRVTSATLPVVVDFSAPWCAPCEKIAPFFAELAGKYQAACFVKVDVSLDELDEIASAAGVTSMPTFHVYRHGKREYCVNGADRSQLEAVVRRAVAFLT